VVEASPVVAAAISKEVVASPVEAVGAEAAVDWNGVVLMRADSEAELVAASVVIAVMVGVSPLVVTETAVMAVVMMVEASPVVAGEISEEVVVVGAASVAVVEGGASKVVLEAPGPVVELGASGIAEVAVTYSKVEDVRSDWMAVE
jgi:hypothetical protein